MCSAGCSSRFAALQSVRDGTALRNAGLLNRNTVAQKLTFTLGFIAVLAIFEFGNLFGSAGGGTEQGGATAGLIVVLISSLPGLYFRFSEMTQRVTQFRIDQGSVSRLMQYEAPPNAVGAPRRRRGRPRRLSRRTALSGSPRCAISSAAPKTFRADRRSLDCVIPMFGMTGVVGPAGSGKSTLIKLILGRQSRLSGTISFSRRRRGPLLRLSAAAAYPV